MQDLNDLYFFARVVELGGFAAAGRALGMPKSTLSRRIALLEERLGLRLIQRSSRRFAVTEIGQEYHRHCLAVLVEAEAAQEAIERTRSGPQGLVRMSCPVALMHFNVAGMLARFMARHPLVRLQLESTNRRVDLIQEGIDLALRVRFPPIEESDLVMRKLADSPQRLVASPALTGARGLTDPARLAGLPSLEWRTAQGAPCWSLEGPAGTSVTIPHAPRLVTDDMAALRAAALEGVGIVQLPTMMVGDDLAAGDLIDALPGWTPRSAVIHAVFPSRRGLLPSVRALIDWLAAEFARLSEAEAAYLGR